MTKKRQLAGIIVCVLGFGATATEAQSVYFSLPGDGPAFFENGRLAGFDSPVSSPVEYDAGLTVDDPLATRPPFLTNDALSLPHPPTSAISHVGTRAGSDVMTFTANGFDNDKDALFARSTFTGLRYDLSPRVSLGLGYKNFAAGDPDYASPPLWNFSGALEEVRTYSILFTLRLKF